MQVHICVQTQYLWCDVFYDMLYKLTKFGLIGLDGRRSKGVKRVLVVLGNQ